MYRLHKRAVLAVGVVLLLFGGLSAFLLGPDDTMVLGEAVQPAASAGLPTVTHPVSNAIGGAELVVRAEAPGGVFLGSAHRIDMTDLLDGIRHVEVSSMGLRNDGTFVEGFPVTLRPAKIVGWLDHGSGKDVQEVRVRLDEDPVDVLAVPVKKDSPVTMSFGVHVAGLFLKSMIVFGAGLLLIVLWWWSGLRLLPGRPDDSGSDADPTDVDRSDDPFATTLYPGRYLETSPAPAPAPAPAVIRPVEDRTTLELTQAILEPIVTADDTPSAPAGTAAGSPTAGTTRNQSRAKQVGAAVGAGALVVGWLARRRSRSTTMMLLLALFLGGCGLVSDPEDSDQKPGLEPAAVQEMLDDYTTRRTRAARKASSPTFDGSFWLKAQTGPMLAASQFEAIENNIVRRSVKAARPRLSGSQVHTPLFGAYPMWAAVLVQEAGKRSLVVFTRNAFADPWMAFASVPVDDIVVPAPQPRPFDPDGKTLDAAEAATALVTLWWTTGEAPGLIVDSATRALREESVPVYFPPVIQPWPIPREREHLVAVVGGDLMITVDSLTIGTRPYVLTSALLLPSVGRPQVLGSSLQRTLG